MLNIGPQELLLVLVIALVVVGPQRLPELGRSIGKALRELRKAQDELRRTVGQGLDTPAREVFAPLRETADEIRRAGRDVSAGLRSPAAPKPKATGKTYPLHRTPPPEESAEAAETPGVAPTGEAGAGPIDRASPDTPSDGATEA